MHRITFAVMATLAVAGATCSLAASSLASKSGAKAQFSPPRSANAPAIDQRGFPECEPAGGILVTENTDTSIDATGSLSCNSNDGTYGHSYGRYHDMSPYGDGTDFELICANWGIQNATHPIAIEINIYRDADGIAVPDSTSGDLVLLASSSGTLDVGSTYFTTSTFDTETVVIPSDALIFVELLVADGSVPNDFGKAADHTVGTNGAGQNSSSWIRTTDGFCGLGSWTTMTNIGFPDLHFVEYLEVRQAAPSDPCEEPLPTVCAGDIWGPLDGPDGEVNVSDLLKVIADWNQIGDGLTRPAADCAPFPNGDCVVDVSDLLKIIADWGGECGPPPSGACCIAPGNCIDGVFSDDCLTGKWTQDATCSGLGCDVADLDLALSEIRTNQPGSDTDEYVEIVGDPGASLDDYTYLIIGDSTTAGDVGVIEEAILLTGFTIPSSGIFLIGEETLSLTTPDLIIPLNHENSSATTYMLVRGFTGFIDDDLDTDDDGVLDLEPWLLVKDSIGFVGPADQTNIIYSDNQVGPDGIYVPAHAIRCGESNWNVGCFDLLGDTPGLPNDCDASDSDADGISNTCDNCPELANEDQGDCDGDGIGDACAIADGLIDDCNGNDIPDNCETDCDGNGTPDDCDIAGGAGDCDGNGILDACEEDCNGINGADICEILNDNTLDANDNGVLDECETPVFVINEINADPSNANDYLDGDANGDGVGSFSDDEFLEFVNYSGSAIDLGNWTVSDGAGLRHVFPIGTVIDDQCALILFGGGTPTGDFGGGLTQIASSGALGLNNGGDDITVSDENGDVVLSVSYGSEAGSNQSITLSPDVYGSSYEQHSTLAPDGSLFSPGYRVDGSPLGSCDVPLDTDLDGVPDSVDNCFDIPNTNQADCDDDGIGDVCEIADGTQIDDNGNGVPDDCEGNGPTTVWINEFHYDNTSSDVNEFCEVVVLDGVDPNQVTVSLYNGNGGVVYNSRNVGAEFAAGETGPGYTIYSLVYPSNGIQNGPDGFCVDIAGDVAMFISYEGVIEATDGPAVGLTSVDVLVSEGSTTIDSSIGLTGTGSVAADFTWTELIDLATAGSSNDGQTIE